MKSIIDRIIILMGGIGSRLDCPQKGFSSKIFFETPKGLVLKNIMDCINNTVELRNVSLEFYLTNETQEKDLLAHSMIINRKFNIKKISLSAHLFSMLKSKETALVIYGDTYFNKNIIRDVVSAYFSNGLSTVALLPTDSGIDNVDFVIENNKIIKVIPSRRQKKEPTQVFLFNSVATEEIVKLVTRSINRFNIMYNYLLPKIPFNVVNCSKNECINLNEMSDLNKVI